MTTPPRCAIVGLFLVWSGALAAGAVPLWRFAYTPGLPVVAPKEWPAADPVSLESSRPTLVMLLHPRCSCSEASLGELSRLMAMAPVPLRVVVVFAIPHEYRGPVTGTRLWHTAQAVPGVEVVTDPDGSVASRFGAHVSGSTLLYDARGQLLFSGGITPARGHAGDNDGASSILRVLAGTSAPTVPTTPVYGCPLHERGTE